jgi:hypothetical protein
MEFPRALRDPVVQKSIELLKSCTYSVLLTPEERPSGPKKIDEVRKGSHLRLVFSTPVTVQVPVESLTLALMELIVSLPLNAGGVWARTENRVYYLAKFDHVTVAELDALLARATPKTK